MSGDAEKPRRGWVSGICWFLAGFFALWTLFRVFGLEGGVFPAVQLVAYTPYLLLLSIPALLAVGLSRRWPAAGILLVAAIALVATVLPRAFGGTEGVPGAQPVRVLTANLAKGKADSVALLDLAQSREADIILLQEVSATKVRNLNRSGWRGAYPHQALDVTETGGGAIFARWPLRQLGSVATGNQPRAVVEIPGASPIEIVSVHPTAPIEPGTTSEWDRDYRSLPVAFSAGLPLVLAGDFNATLDHKNLRDLLGTGYRDAADVTGQGFVPTWPSRPKVSLKRISLPVTIDHVLAEEGISFSEYDVEEIKGSDHQAVFAELLLPAKPGSN